MICARGCPFLQKMLWLFALTLLTSCTQQARAANGGLKIRLTQKGLEYGKEFGLQMLTSALKKEQIQDINGSYKVPVIGLVNYFASGIHLKQLQVNHSTIGFLEGTGLNLTIQNAQFTLSGAWNLSTSLGSESGTADVNIEQLSLSALLGLDKDDQGRPSVWYAGCHSSVGGLHLKFYGRSSWVFNTFASVVKGILRSEVNKQLCTELRRGIDELAQVLRTMNVSAQISSIAGIDYFLVNKPAIGVDRCDVDLKGEIFRVGDSSRSPLLPAPFHLPDQSDSMLLLGISDFSVNSAASVYFKAGALQVVYTDKMIPKSVPFRLNTNTMGALIPELKVRFPNMDMEFHLAARKPPVLGFHPHGLDATIFGSAEAFVVLPNARRVSVFQLNVDTNLTGQVYLYPVKSENSFGKAGGLVEMKAFRLWLERSSIGEIKAPLLEKLLKLAGQFALSRVNKNLKKGVFLTDIGGATVMNPKVSMHEGYMLVETDLHHQMHTTV